jgi:hypothetical protein
MYLAAHVPEESKNGIWQMTALYAHTLRDCRIFVERITSYNGDAGLSIDSLSQIDASVEFTLYDEHLIP